MKLLLVKLLGQFNDEEHIEFISEINNDIPAMKNIGLEFASKLGKNNAEWVDWSPPTMGDDKLKEPSKFLLELSENEFLVIRE